MKTKKKELKEIEKITGQILRSLPIKQKWDIWEQN
jgi:hypothetical protein